MHIFSTGWFIGAEVQSFFFEGVSPCCLQWLSRWSLKIRILKNRFYCFLFLRKCQKVFECLMTHRCPRFSRDDGNWGHCHVMRVWNFEILKSNFIQRRSKLDGGSFVRTKTQWRAGQQKPMADQNAMHSPAFLAQPSFLCNKALPDKETKCTFMILAVFENFWRHLVLNQK